MVEGEFRITNQNFWPGLENPESEEYKSMAQSIEYEVSEYPHRLGYLLSYKHPSVFM